MYELDVDLIVKLISNDKLWDSLSALSALFSAIAAYAAVKLSVTFRKQDQMYKRAYLAVKDPKMQSAQKDHTVKINIPFENHGEHAAEDVAIRIIMANQTLDSEPDFNILENIANPIPGKTPSAYVNEIIASPNCPNKLLLVRIEYKDVILNKRFIESYYMKWSGISNAEFQVNICHANHDEKLKFQKYLSQRGM